MWIGWPGTHTIIRDEPAQPDLGPVEYYCESCTALYGLAPGGRTCFWEQHCPQLDGAMADDDHDPDLPA